MSCRKQVVFLLAICSLLFLNTFSYAQSNNGDSDKPSIPDEWMSQFDWRSIGPANMSGRITSIAVYEQDPRIWYIASASGGLLKTTNNGINFEHQFDDQATVSIGDVQVYQKDPNIVWVGTGEANPRNSVSWGDGVYKSTDGGETWKNMGLKESFQIGRIAIHPEDPNIVYVGALGRLWGPSEERGLFKTTDGGETWEKIHFVNDMTGVIDVKMHPKDPDTLLVATYERMRDGFDGNDPVKKYGEGSGLYRTTDGGKTFEKVTEGMPSCKLGRIGLDWYRKNPKIVYAIVESEKIASVPENRGYAGFSGENADVGARITDVVADGPAAEGGLKNGDIVVEVDGDIVNSYNDFLAELRRRKAGDKVKLTVSRDRETEDLEITLGKRPERQARGGRRGRGGGNNEFTGTLGGQAANLQGQQGGENEEEFGGVYMSKDAGKSWQRINTLNPRPMYYSQVRVDPSNNDNLYVLGTSLYRSSDGGETFTGDGGRGVHPDNHAMWIDPKAGDHIILGNDGGIYVTYDRMDNWDHYNHIAIGQFYHVGLDATRDYKVYGGLQDNGSWGGPAQTRTGGPVNTDWFRVGGGDGFITLVDPTDPDQIFFESQNGAMGRNNLRTGDRGFIRPRPPRGTRYRFNWKTPFILSPHNPQIHYSAGNYVFRSTARGDGVVAISPEITNTDRGAGSAISESAVTAGVIYVGTTDGAVWMTRDDGKTWEEIFVQKQEAEEEAEEESEEEAADETATAESSSEERAPRARERRQRGNRGRRAERERERAAESTEETADEAESAEMEDASPLAALVGNWKGQMNFDQLPEDQRWVEMKVEQNDDGQLVGEFKTPRSVTSLSKFELNADSGAVSFEGSNEQIEEIGFKGEFDAEAGTIKGEIDMGQFQVDFEVSKSDSVSTTSAPVQLVAYRVTAPVEDAVTGVWTATMEMDDIPEGSMEFSMEMKLDDDGNVTGYITSPMGEMEIFDGRFNSENGKLTMEISSEDAGMSAEVEATIKGASLNGTIKGGNGAFEVDFTAERTSTELPEEESAEKADSQPESEATEGAEARQEATAATSDAAKPATDEGPANGKWEGKVISESGFMQGDRAKVIMNLKQTGDKLTGFVEVMQNETGISDGTYSAENGEFSFVLENERFDLTFTGTIKDESMTGELDFAGRRSFEFEAKRVSKSANVAVGAAGQESGSSGDGSQLGDLVPGPRWVSSIEASKHKAGRVYLTLDGHRSNDDEPYVFVSENYGKTWSSLRANLPTEAGSTRVLREDIENENLLFLGCEFSAWVSIDRGKSWTRFQGGLPTVAVHEFAIHPSSGEIVAGTHGRSLWVCDITGLRKLTDDVMGEDAALLEPNAVVRWRRGPEQGASGTRRFVGENPDGEAKIYYYIGDRTQNASITISSLTGEVIRTLEADTEVGLHRVDWDLRRQPREGQNQGGRRFRGGGGVPTGQYLVTLDVDGQEYKQVIEIQQDPVQSSSGMSEEEWELLLEYEGVGDDDQDDQ